MPTQFPESNLKSVLGSWSGRGSISTLPIIVLVTSGKPFFPLHLSGPYSKCTQYWQSLSPRQSRIKSGLCLLSLWNRQMHESWASSWHFMPPPMCHPPRPGLRVLVHEIYLLICETELTHVVVQNLTIQGTRAFPKAFATVMPEGHPPSEGWTLPSGGFIHKRNSRPVSGTHCGQSFHKDGFLTRRELVSFRKTSSSCLNKSCTGDVSGADTRSGWKDWQLLGLEKKRKLLTFYLSSLEADKMPGDMHDTHTNTHVSTSFPCRKERVFARVL